MRGGETSFERALALVEEAKRELVATTPSPRGRQVVTLPDALMRFEELLGAARALLEAAPASHPGRRLGVEALDESLRRAERLRLEAPALDYEGLVGTLAELIDPLDAFHDLQRGPA